MPIRRISPELIDEVCGSVTPTLSVLNLSHNEIATVENLDRLAALTRLDLSHNRITRLTGLESLSRLSFLSLTSNRLRAVTGLEHLRLLEVLLLGDNQLGSVACLRALSWLPELRTLTLAGSPAAVLPRPTPRTPTRTGHRLPTPRAGNPLADASSHTAFVASLLPRLTLLDGEPLQGRESPPLGALAVRTSPAEVELQADRPRPAEPAAGEEEEEEEEEEEAAEEARRQPRALQLALPPLTDLASLLPPSSCPPRLDCGLAAVLPSWPPLPLPARDRRGGITLPRG